MKKLFIRLLLFVTLTIQATTYYVSNTGNDASAGTSVTNTWAHHPWMSTWTGSTVLVAGDIVYMNAQITSAIDGNGHHVPLDAYGNLVIASQQVIQNGIVTVKAIERQVGNSFVPLT